MPTNREPSNLLPISMRLASEGMHRIVLFLPVFVGEKIIPHFLHH